MALWILIGVSNLIPTEQPDLIPSLLSTPASLLLLLVLRTTDKGKRCRLLTRATIASSPARPQIHFITDSQRIGVPVVHRYRVNLAPARRELVWIWIIEDSELAQLFRRLWKLSRIFENYIELTHVVAIAILLASARPRNPTSSYTLHKK